MKAGRPSAGKKPLNLDDMKPKTKRVSADIDTELHRKIKQRALDEDKKVMDLIVEVLEDAFR